MSTILMVVLVGIAALVALAIAGVVLPIVAAVTTSNRRPHTSPLTIRFVR